MREPSVTRRRARRRRGPKVRFPRSTRTGFLVGVCIAASASLLLGACSRANGGFLITTDVNVVRFAPGERHASPQFSGPALKSEGQISNEVLRGKIGVINFWGSWCGPCRREQPLLEQLSKDYANRGVQFLGINERDQKAAALAYLDEFKVTYPSIYNPDSSIAYPFKVRYMPHTYVIDRNGKIAAEIIGALFKESDLKDVLDRELAL